MVQNIDIQDLFIIGANGNVGRALVKQILTRGDTMPGDDRNFKTRIVGLASSRQFVFSRDGISDQFADEFSRSRNVSGARGYDSLDALLDAANGRRVREGTLAFVDVTAVGEPMTRFHKNVELNTPYGLVTANKNPIALSPYGLFQKLTRDVRRYGYRCSVMAGAGAVPFLQDMRDLNDPLGLITGCLSGTLGFICSQLEYGKMFSEILADAKEKGYTEPDPRDDLNGLDVARKLIVLARSAGYNVGLSDVDVEPFIPGEYFVSGQSVEEFMASAKGLDSCFIEAMASARERCNTLRYVANLSVSGKTPTLKVSLQEVPVDSELGSLRGTTNKLVIVTGAYDMERPYIIQAPGAGLDVTARNIRRDLLSLLPHR